MTADVARMTCRFGAVILAAGESVRMGRPKQLLPWGAGTVLGAVAAAALASPADEVVAVLGHQAEAVARVVPPGVRCVVNPRCAEGMLASVQAGVAALSPDCDGFLLFLGDQPLTSPAVAAALVRAYEPGLILVPVHEGRRGHPVLFSLAYREEIAQLDPQVGLRQLLRVHPEAVRHVPVEEPSIHIDIDTPEEYERWRV